MGRGAAAIGLAQAVRIATQLASVVVLSRLLAPEDFGIVAMCAPVLALVTLCQNLGLNQATIQKAAITHEEVNYLFWINVAVSIALAGLLAAAAPLIAAFYGEPKVGPLIAAMGLTVLALGLGAQHLALLNRRMAFGKLAAIEVAGALAGFGVAVGWALVERSYWALYAGALTSAVLPSVCYWAASRWRPGLPRAAEAAGGLLRFGAGITGFNLSNFVARNLDNVLIGRYWGSVDLGLYDRAYKLLLFPLRQIADPLARIMIPALSRLNGEPERYRSAYLRVVPLLLLAVLPGVACATALSDLLIPFVLGEKWRASSAIFMALGFAGLLQPLNNPAGWLFISQGRSGDFLRWGIVTAVTAALAFAIGLPYGALGVAVAYSVSEYLRTPFLWLYVGRKGPLRASDLARTAGPLVLAAHLALAALWLARPLLPGHPLAALLMGAAVSYMMVVAVGALFPSGRAALREGLQLLSGGRLGGATAGQESRPPFAGWLFGKPAPDPGQPPSK